LDLAIDVFFDVGVVHVEDEHLGGAARGAAALDCAGGAVADLEEAHQAGGDAAAAEWFALAADLGVVDAAAAAMLEDARLAHPEVHNAVRVDQVVLDGLDEAGAELRVDVRRVSAGELAGERVDVVAPTWAAGDPVRPIQAGVEELGAVWCEHLVFEHGDGVFVEGAGRSFAGEVSAPISPVGPCAGDAGEDLFGAGLRAEGGVGGRDAPLQPFWDIGFGDRLGGGWDAALAGVLFSDDLDGGQREGLRSAEAIEVAVRDRGQIQGLKIQAFAHLSSPFEWTWVIIAFGSARRPLYQLQELK